MSDPYKELEQHFQKLSRIEHAITFLQWDQQVMMPPGGNEARAQSLAELVSIHHTLLSDAKLEDLLGEAEVRSVSAEIQQSLHEMKRQWLQASCLPSRLVKQQSLAGSRCEHGWRDQRKENNWKGFLTNFEEVVALSREEAQTRQDADPDTFTTPYDTLLDLYCTGDSSSLIENVFSELKSELPSLLSTVADNHKLRPDNLTGEYPIEDQIKLNRTLSSLLGFDFTNGRIDISNHPFSTGDTGDQRITTRYRSDDFLEALKATAHETGHASYESGLPRKWAALPVGQARNSCIHESQSLLFEKQLFLAKPFIQFFTKEIHHCLPSTLPVDHERLWRSFTRVQPSLIRVDADEVSYPLHIILRFEIESALINGDLRAADIPEIWNDKMTHYIGLSTAGNDRDGCLQDIHWTDGSFGYFPAYTIGAVNAAQLFSAIIREHSNWQELLLQGNSSFIRVWLEKHIWSKGSTCESQQIIQEATGEKTSARYFLEYLRNRYIQELY